MLDLARTFTGCPAGPLKYLVLPHANLIVYSSADAVVILNASSLALVRVLALREVFPGAQQTVSCLAVDSALKVVRPFLRFRRSELSLAPNVDCGVYRHTGCRMVAVRSTKQYLSRALILSSS